MKKKLKSNKVRGGNKEECLFLGQGAFRKVYSTSGKRVIKVADNSIEAKTCNKDESLIWELSKGTPSNKFLAPVLSVSQDYSILLMARTTPIKNVDEIPDTVPDWMADIKPENWGWLNGSVVCHDYANNFCFENSLERAKMVSAEKWEPVLT